MDTTTVVTAVGGLVSAIGFLFKLLMKANKERMEESKERAKEHAMLCERVGTLEGERRGIEALSKKTLEVVHSAIADKESQ